MKKMLLALIAMVGLFASSASVVDVFGVPNTEPTVMYKYRTLPIVASENIINSNGGNIINGKRYVFAYYQDANWGAVDSGDIIVKKYATVVDSLHVQ